MALKMTLFSALVTAIGACFFAGDDDDLPDDVNARLHLNLGRDSEGNIRYFSRVGALQDFLNWFGLDTPVRDIQDIMRGKRTWEEVIKDAGKTMVADPLNSLGPQFTVPLGLMADASLYPNPFEPTHIYDKWEFVFNSVGMKDEYRAVTEKPTKGYGKTWAPGKLLWYSSDSGETSYYTVRDMVQAYKADKYGENKSWFDSPKSEALYNVKTALRYGDQKAAEKYIVEYIHAGGTEKGLEQSLKSLHPLNGIKKDDQNKFIDGLSNADQEKVARAIDFYEAFIENKKGIDYSLFKTVKPEDKEQAE